MAVTLEELASYLENSIWSYRMDHAEQRLLIEGHAAHLDNFLIVAQLEEDGEFFKLFAPQVLTGLQHHPHKLAILQTMLRISWETKMLQWEYDPSDGEIRAIIEFPLEDATLTERQFNRCLDGLMEIIDEIAMPRLLAVLETGDDPSDLEFGERLLLTLQEEAPGLLNMLEQAMEARKRRGQFPRSKPD
ncbi:MAG: hypothetical protein AAF289_22770 [Cyanobacteria bacterium P01_A01_bin.135]